jgi:hypothetical protein
MSIEIAAKSEPQSAFPDRFRKVLIGESDSFEIFLYVFFILVEIDPGVALDILIKVVNIDFGFNFASFGRVRSQAFEIK